MTPSEFAEDELAEWQAALADQRLAERELLDASASASADRLQDLVQQVERARIRADLLLADAVQLKCSYRDSRRAPLEAPAQDALQAQRR